MLSNRGQSLVEIVIALGIFAVIASSSVSLVLSGLVSLERGRQLTRASALAREGLEAVRVIRDRDWNELSYSRSAVAVSGNRWVFSGEGTTEQIGEFERTIDFFPVYRDSSGNIADPGFPGARQDASSTRVAVSVNWEIRPGVTSAAERETYLTR